MKEVTGGPPGSRAAAVLPSIVAGLVAISTRLGPLQNPDILWQVRSGELILARGARLTTDPFSWLFRGQPVLDHETGFEALAAFLHAHGGMSTLWWTNLALVTLAAVSSVYLVRSWVASGAARIVGAAIVLTVVATRVELRAESVTFAAIAIAHGLRRGSDSWARTLSPIAVVACAAPFHALAFLVAVVPLAHAGEAILDRRRREAVVNSAVAVVAVLAGELAAPGMLAYIRASRAATAAYSHVVEGYSPLHYVIAFGDPMPFIALATAVFAAWGLLRLHREGTVARRADVILIALLMVPGVRYVRFAPIAVLATLPWSIAGVARLVAPLRKRVPSRTVAGLVATVAAALAASFATATLGFEGIGGFAWDKQPRETVEWMRTHRPNAALFHPYNFGAYLIYAGYPPRGVLVDPRGPMVYPNEFVARYYEAVGDPAKFEAWHREQPFDTVLLARRHKGSDRLREHLLRHPQFRLIREDAASFVFVLR